MLGPAAESLWLLESLTALLEAGCRWSEAADRSPYTLPVPFGLARTPSASSASRVATRAALLAGS